MASKEGEKLLPGVYLDKKKNGKPNYRSSITINTKHISLGSYSSMETASKAYEYAKFLWDSPASPSDYMPDCPLSFEKYIVILNYRDNGIYFSNPIYLDKRFFNYYYSPDIIYKFDMDDLFYFSSHKIMRRGNHIFVSDYGSQISVYEHLGIKSFSVPGRDFRFINGDSFDFRRENIEIINRYFGVIRQTGKLNDVFKAYINIKGKFVIGVYDSEIEAAIAFNKAADIVTQRGINKKYPQNYIEGISPREYASIYSEIKISEKLYNI